MRFNSEIIDIIISEKDKKGLSLSELARRTGVAKSAMSRYLNKTRQFPLNKAQEFANVLGISVEYLLGYSAIPAVLEKQLSEQEKEDLLKNPQRVNELSDLAWQRYTVKMHAIDNKKDNPVNIEDIKTRINKRYGTNAHGDDAYTAISVGAGEHDFHFIRLFDELLDLDERDGTYTADLLYKYLILDNDSKRIVSELIDNLPQTNVKSLFSEDNN